MASLKTYLDEQSPQLTETVKNIQYVYNLTPQIYLADTTSGVQQVNPDTLLNSYLGTGNNIGALLGFGSSSGMNMFHEMPGDLKLFAHQYEVRAGRWPETANEAVVVVGRNDQISDYLLYTLSLRDRQELKQMLEIFTTDPNADVALEASGPFDYQDLLGAKLKIINPADRYIYDETYHVWLDRSENPEHMRQLIDKSRDLKIVGVVRPNADTSATSLSMGVNYAPELIADLMTEAAAQPIVQEQLAAPTVNVLSGKTFVEENEENQNNPIAFSDFITVDEEQIRAAFSIDSSQISLDFSGLGNFQFTPPNLPPPDLILPQVLSSLAGQFSVPTEPLTELVNDLVQNFLAEKEPTEETDLNQLAADFGAYLMREDVRQFINLRLQQIFDFPQMLQQFNQALGGALEKTVQSYVTQMLTALQSQVSLQIETQAANLLAQLPQQLQNALTIDPALIESAFQLNMSEDDILELMNSIMNPVQSTFEQNLTRLGYANPEAPTQINIYAQDFNSKAEIEKLLAEYNQQMESQGEKEKIIRYTDLVGTMMTSVTEIVDMISYALVAFVSISLVVSSIMIGVITYISVLERKKEIGILRAIGASKKDIRRVFNAETLIIGFIAGLIGISVTYLLSLIANQIVYERMGVANIAQLPARSAAVLVGISMLLAFISGLFPASAAARKDPVEALRSE